ncbi:hypothetical protein OROMI_016975 [Orobanche minor]
MGLSFVESSELPIMNNDDVGSDSYSKSQTELEVRMADMEVDPIPDPEINERVNYPNVRVESQEPTFSPGGRVIDKRTASTRKDKIEVLLCGGDWIKEVYGIRTPQNEREENDPIDLENKKEYEMTYPRQSNPPGKPANHPTKRPRSSSGKPQAPRNKRKLEKSRRT